MMEGKQDLHSEQMHCLWFHTGTKGAGRQDAAHQPRYLLSELL